jgi:hypothetical protein
LLNKQVEQRHCIAAKVLCHGKSEMLDSKLSDEDATRTASSAVMATPLRKNSMLAFLDEHSQFPDAEAVANLASGRVGVAGLAGPGESHIRNPDGDDIVFVDATATLESAILRSQTITELLNGSQNLQESDNHEWAIVRVDDPGLTHRGSVEVIDTDPVQLRIVTNSEARFGEAISMLTEILGNLRLGVVFRDSAEDVSLARDLGLVGRN